MREELAEKAKIIEAILFDVDGVMTDGKIYCSEGGETLKAFNAADGLGITLLRRFNVITGVISGRDSTALRFRLEDLNIRHLYLGTRDKLAAFKQFLNEVKLTPEQVAFIGDDLPDLPVLTRCGFAVAPRNGCKEVRSKVDYVTDRLGGDGSIREVVELILKSKGLWEDYIKGLH
jgi:3-deoxy-D-manno-octulosonate 8-phosphate phosphatase (KDO 8-P phosphatase)